MMRYARGAIALIALIAVVIQYVTFLSSSELGFAGSTIRYFSYFTIWTNVLIAIGWGSQACWPQSRLGQLFARDDVRTAATSYIVLVGITYHALLAAQYNPQGLQLFADVLLHTVIPVAVFVEWLAGSGERGTRFTQVPRWQIYPVVYTAYTLIKGAITGFYPYPFLDVGTLGYGGVAIQLAGLIVFFTLTSLALVAIGKMRSRISR
jgi:hypothetical protein